jgi:hypothetical protein
MAYLPVDLVILLSNLTILRTLVERRQVGPLTRNCTGKIELQYPSRERDHQ